MLNLNIISKKILVRNFIIASIHSPKISSTRIGLSLTHLNQRPITTTPLQNRSIDIKTPPHPAIKSRNFFTSGTESLSKPPLENPNWRLTGTILKEELTLDVFSKELEKCRALAKAHHGSAHLAFLPYNKLIKLEAAAVHYRNFLAKALWLDDKLRFENKRLENQHLEDFLKEVDGFLTVTNETLKKSKFLEGLVRVHAALKFRLNIKTKKEINEEEKNLLLNELTKLRKKAVLHLIPSHTQKLLDLSFEELTSLKLLSPRHRLSHLDLICPLNIGLNSLQLEEFVVKLPKASQDQLNPLIEKRKKVIDYDELWSNLIDKRLIEWEILNSSLQSISTQAKEDLRHLENCPIFAEIFLEYGSYFLEDLFRNHHIMNIVSLKEYLISPHILILLEEQHLNKQIYAAGDTLKRWEKDPYVLMIKSSLNKTPSYIFTNDIPFENTYIPDDFQRLLREEQLRCIENAESSSQTKNIRISYLPGKGLCKYDPTEVPEKIEDFTPYESSKFKDSFTPAVSYRDPKATVLGTHAFTELYSNYYRYIPGKFSSFQYNYDKVNTYLKIFFHLLPKALGPHPCAILSPDHTIGHDNDTRAIATLKRPIPINAKQIKHMHQTLKEHHLGINGREFRILNNNCTALTEEFLQIAGVDLPCKAPLHALLKISHPFLSIPFKWISNYPNIANPILKSLGQLLGAQGEHQLTVDTLNNIMTPYVPRIWIELKNCHDDIEIKK